MQARRRSVRPDLMDDTSAEHLREQRFQALLEGVPVAAYRWEAGSAGRCLYVSPQIETMLGFPPEQWMADPELWLQRIHPDDRARVMSDEGDAKTTGVLDNEYRFLHADGRIVWVRDQARWVVDEDGQACFEGVFADVTEGKRAELELTYTAQHDPLTGLVNRRQFTRQLEHELTQGRAGTSAVLFVDIDRFKLVNDGHGHDAGDALLREAGVRLQAALREGDVLSRFGGDEFTAYLPNCDAGCAEVVARRVLATLAQPFPVARGEVYVGGSVGIALTGGDADAATDLIRDADVAMYVAKQGGRGRLALFDTSLREASAKRIEMVSALHRALELNEIEMELQPIVDLGDGRLAGVEALLRWRRGGTVVPPLDFVPLAEESGLIADIERFALAEACRLGQRLAALHGEPIAVSVNVSPRHALQGDLALSVEHALRITGFDPGSLLVELTESERIEDVEGLADVLGAVRELGVSVALDDFGTGWSTLGLLRRVPFDALKIDRSFTAGLPASRSDRALVAAIVTLARSLGVPAVAEGIERPEQLAWLREVGCDLGQGYLFARPSTVEGLATWLAQLPAPDLDLTRRPRAA
jgi:diguanylate cyclase (GGDEF)-like protein/PAS domain S-box-containing protein